MPLTPCSWGSNHVGERPKCWATINVPLDTPLDGSMMGSLMSSLARDELEAAVAPLTARNQKPTRAKTPTTAWNIAFPPLGTTPSIADTQQGICRAGGRNNCPAWIQAHHAGLYDTNACDSVAIFGHANS